MEILRKVHLSYLPAREGGEPEPLLLALFAVFPAGLELTLAPPTQATTCARSGRTSSRAARSSACVVPRASLSPFSPRSDADSEAPVRVDGHGSPLLPPAQVRRPRRVHVGRLDRRRGLDVPARQGRRHQCVPTSSSSPFPRGSLLTRSLVHARRSQPSSPSRTARACSSTTCTSCASRATTASGSSPRSARPTSASFSSFCSSSSLCRSSDTPLGARAETCRSRRRSSRSRASSQRSRRGRPASPTSTSSCTSRLERSLESLLVIGFAPTRRRRAGVAPRPSLLFLSSASLYSSRPALSLLVSFFSQRCGAGQEGTQCRRRARRRAAERATESQAWTSLQSCYRCYFRTMRRSNFSG